jgi:hypothetical protein
MSNYYGKASNDAIAYYWYVGMQLHRLYEIAQGRKGEEYEKYLEAAKKKEAFPNDPRLEVGCSGSIGIEAHVYQDSFPQLISLKDKNGNYYMWSVSPHAEFLDTFINQDEFRKETPKKPICHFGGAWFSFNRCINDLNLDQPVGFAVGGSDIDRSFLTRAAYLDRTTERFPRTRKEKPVDKSDFRDLYNFALAIVRFKMDGDRLASDLSPWCEFEFKHERKERTNFIGHPESAAYYDDYTASYCGCFTPFFDKKELTPNEQKIVEDCWQKTKRIDELLAEYATLGRMAFSRKSAIKKEIMRIREEQTEDLKPIVVRRGVEHIERYIENRKQEVDGLQRQIPALIERSKDKRLNKMEREAAKEQADKLSNQVKVIVKEQIDEHQKIINALSKK